MLLPQMAAFGQDMKEAFWIALYEDHEAGKIYYLVNNTEEYGYQMTSYTVLRDKRERESESWLSTSPSTKSEKR